MANRLKLRATKRFVRSFERASPPLRHLAQGALRDLVNFATHAGAPNLTRYTQVKGLEPPVREVPVAGGERMLVHQAANEIFLLDLGNHEVVTHYKDTGKVRSEIKNCKPLPKAIHALTESRFFPQDHEESWRELAEEADSKAWLYYLDDHQSAVLKSIEDRIRHRSSERDWNFVIVAGGPGTGKTSLLLKLTDQIPDLQPQFVMSDAVAEQIRQSARMDLADFRCTLDWAKRQSRNGILLVDDPIYLSDIERARELAQSRVFRAVVVGVDPFQLSSDCTDQQFRALASGSGSALYELRSCYRQKRVVGLATKQALESIASSSPYLDASKQQEFAEGRRELVSLVNDLEFPNPSGRFRKYLSPTPAQIGAEFKRLASAPRLWQHSPPYLIAWDREGLSRLPRACATHLRSLRLPHRLIELNQAVDVRGLEFQHAVIVISDTLFDDLESGFVGASRRGYDQRRLLRIPMSRAKDSITVFVFPRAQS